jgi:hypothetical protein
LHKDRTQLMSNNLLQRHEMILELVCLDCRPSGQTTQYR